MEIHQVAIDVQDPIPADELQKFVKKKLDEMPGEPLEPRAATIFRLPSLFYETNKDLCEPMTVSIGPYCHGKESVRAMEEKKWSNLRDFLARNSDVGFEVYLRDMRLLERQARECYSEAVNLGSNDFIIMLLLDGCFILENLLKREAHDWGGIYSTHWCEGCMTSDLCLLENQIPFFIIHMLFVIQGRCGQNCQNHCPLLGLIDEVAFFPQAVFQFRRPQIPCREIQHLLHLYYSGVLPRELEREQRDMAIGKSCLGGLKSFLCSLIFSKSSSAISQSAKSTEIGSFINELIPCATELQMAGVQFRRKQKPRDIFNITFQNGTLEVPLLLIDNNIKKFLFNMVAFEQSQPTKFPQILTSYVAFMNSLINTEKDVAILVRSGVIANLLQNDEQAATFFNQFSDIFGLNYSDHYLHGVFKDVKLYSESTWHKHRARLMGDYFSNPWSAISVVAASILLILTFVQTYYSVS